MTISELNANGAEISRQIVYEALRMAGVIPEPPHADLKEWEWKSSHAQFAMARFTGMATTYFVAPHATTEDVAAYLAVPHDWYIAGIRVKDDSAIPTDVLQLWHKERQVMNVINLAQPPQL